MQAAAPVRARSTAATEGRIGGGPGAVAATGPSTRALVSRARATRALANRTLVAAALALAAAALAAPIGRAHAQNADAEALFTEAETLEAAGKIAEACDAFESSNRIEARAGTLIRLGQCRETQGRLVSAWSAYKDALTRVKDPAKKQVAEARVAALAPTLSYLTVSVPDEARIDGLVVLRNGKPLDPALWNRAAPVDGGVYTVSGQAPGHESWSTSVEVAAASDKVSVDVPRFKELRTLVETAPAPTTGPVATADPVDRAGPGLFTPRRKIAVGVGAVGLLAIAGGVVLGIQATGFEDDAFALCPDPNVPCANAEAAQDKIDTGNDRALYANIAYGVGGAAIVGAAVLWFTGGAKAKAEPARVGLAPRLGRVYSGVDLTVRF